MIWATNFMCFVSVLSDTHMTASGLSPVQLEREALINSGWWNNSTENASDPSDHCKWMGITCNLARSVSEISLGGHHDVKRELGRFNFSSFVNLESFKICFSYVSGNIPSQTGALSKLHILILSWNNLIGTNQILLHILFQTIDIDRLHL